MRRAALAVLGIMGVSCGGAQHGGQRRKDSVAIFVPWSDGSLIPLACYDASMREMRGEAVCLSVVPKDAKAVVDGKQTVRITGQTTATCDGNGATTPALTYEGEQGGMVAVWPPSAGKMLEPVERLPEEEGAPGLQLPADEAKALEKVIRAAAPAATGPLDVRQAVKQDLDGDGKPERLYSVLVHVAEGDDSEFAFSGLLLANGRAPLDPWIGEQSTYERFEVRWYLDLDGDGRKEVWIDSPYYEGSASLIVRLSGKELELIGGWECGA